MIDLSTLTIPPPEIVPEPTAENLKAFAAFCEEANSGTDEFMIESLRDRWPATAIYFARRCRELEAANTEHWPTSDPTAHQKRDALYRLCKRIIGDRQNQWLSEAAIETIEKLEAEVKRLGLVERHFERKTGIEEANDGK